MFIAIVRRHLLYAKHNFRFGVKSFHDFIGDRLEIGRYCAIAANTRFIMNGANHAMDGFSTFPFAIFGGAWRDGYDLAKLAGANRGDTIVGNDAGSAWRRW